MILQSLRRQPMHGYVLVQHIKQRSNEPLQVEEGSLNPPCNACCGIHLVLSSAKS